LGASFDPPSDNRVFREKFSFPFDLLSDIGREVGTAYGVFNPDNPDYADRTSFLIDPEGRIERVYIQIEPITHSDQVLRDLQ
jgi:peroxiredoxin Q/BCP